MSRSHLTFCLCLAAIGCASSSRDLDTADDAPKKHTSAKKSSSKPKPSEPSEDAGSTSAGEDAATGAPMAMPDDEDMRPPPSGLPDVVFTMDVTVPRGGEELECLYAAFPSDRGVIAVSGADSEYTPGSHHFLAYRSDLIGVPEDQTGVFDCPDNAWMHNRGSYYEAQQPKSHRDLPPGVAHLFQPNEVVILQAHYINTTDDDLRSHIEFRLHTMDPDKVENEAGSILFSNALFSIPAHARQRVTMSCPLSQDFHPALLWSHMHHRSSNFVATSDDAQANAVLGTLYAEPDWNEPKPREYPYDPPATLHAGTSITFSCDMNNDTDADLIYGISAQTNEMCILHGMYWPRMKDGGEGCLDGTTWVTDL